MNEHLSGVHIVLPTRDTHRTIEEVLGPVLDTLVKADIDLQVLIEYILDQWINAEIDQVVLQMNDTSPERLITHTSVMDFVISNNQIREQGLDRESIINGVQFVCYYVFSEIIPMIQSLQLSEPALRGLHIVQWMGRDMVVKFNRPK